MEISVGERQQKEVLIGELSDLIKRIAQNHKSQSDAFRFINEKIGYSESSLKRVISGKALTQPRTALNLAKLAYPTLDDDLKVVEELKVDFPLVRDHILKEVDSLTLRSHREIKDEIDNDITSDTVYRAIYILIASGGSTIQEIKEEHGKRGLRTLEKMLDQEVAKTEGDVIKIGAVAPSIDFSVSTAISRDIVNNHFKSEKLKEYGKNYLRYIMYPTSRKTFEDLIRIDMEATRKKIELLKKSEIPTDTKDIIRYLSVTHVDALGPIIRETPDEEVKQ